MSFGIKVLNDSGNLQIDQDYYNYVVMQQGTTTKGRFYYTGTEDGSNLVFIHPQVMGSQNYTFSYGSTAGGFLGGNFWNPNPGSYVDLRSMGSSGNILYVTASNLNIYSYPGSLNAEFGMRVFDSDGYAAFDSRFPYLNVAAVYYLKKGTIGTSAYGHADISLPQPPAGKRYYVMLNHMTMSASEIYTYGDGSADEETFGGAISKMSDTTFRIHFAAYHELNELARGGTTRRLADSHTFCVMVIIR